MIYTLYVNETGIVATDLSAEEIAAALHDSKGLLWVDLEKPSQREGVDLLSNIFKFHPLAVEDCFHPLQYPRIDTYSAYIFVVVHAVCRNGSEKRLENAELDFFVGPNYVVTFRTDPMPALEKVREAGIKDPRKLRRGSDWLAHDILDALVDGYLPVIDELTDRVEELEQKALEGPTHSVLGGILAAKRELAGIHRISIPLRETISRFSRERLDNIRPETQAYFRDIFDHMVRITETSDLLRETTDGALTIYAMSQNNKATEVVKILTVLATVALPALIIASIYGMNFRHMPELSWKYGYLFSLLVIGGISAVMIGFFKYKKWL